MGYTDYSQQFEHFPQEEAPKPIIRMATCGRFAGESIVKHGMVDRELGGLLECAPSSS